MKALKKYPTNLLINELSRRGFAVNDLWQIADVDNHISQYIENYDGKGRSKLTRLSRSAKLAIINEVLGGDGTNIAVNDTLSDLIYDIANTPKNN